MGHWKHPPPGGQSQIHIIFLILTISQVISGLINKIGPQHQNSRRGLLVDEYFRVKGADVCLFIVIMNEIDQLVVFGLLID